VIEPSATTGGFLEVGRKLRRGRAGISTSVLLAFMVIAVVVFCAIFGTAIAPRSPYQVNLRAGVVGPNKDFILGTDANTQDVLSRTIVGARAAVWGPGLVATGAMIIACVLGLVAGYLGGAVDALVMRWVDIMYALPSLLVIIVVAGVIAGRGGTLLPVFLLMVLYSPQGTRLVRGVV
jgi:peptide/nickel transport system permease protein